MSDQLRALLDSTPTSDRVRAVSWDLYYASPDADQLGRVLEKVSLPPAARIQMIEMKAREAAQAAGPSPTSRFVSNAAEVLNPVTAVEGLYNAVRHPVDTATNVWNASAEQGRQAAEAFGQGRYSEAVGHAGGMIPLVGPIAVEAGEQIASGDVAGGLGKATGLLLPFGASAAARGAAKATQAIPAGARTRAAGALERGAADRVADVMRPEVGPNKTRFGNKAQEVAPKVAQDMAQNGAPLTREGLHAQVGERLAAAERALDEASDARLTTRSFETKPVIDALLEKRRALTAETVEGSHRIRAAGEGGQLEAVPLGRDVVPGPNASRVAAIDQAISEIQQLGPVATYESIRRVRQAYDQQARPKYSPSMTADYMKAQGGASGAADVTGVLREHLARWDPQTAVANADYHVYRTANDVLDATMEAERTRPRVGRAIVARLTGTVAGGQAAGTAGAVGGYVLGPVVDSALSSGMTLKLKTANVMSKLAAAIRRGDVESVDGLARQLRRVQGGAAVQRTNERATSPNESQSGPVAVPGTR